MKAKNKIVYLYSFTPFTFRGWQSIKRPQVASSFVLSDLKPHDALSAPKGK